MRDKHKRKQRIFWVLLLAALVWYGSLTGSGRSGGGTYNVQAATTNVVARFWNTNIEEILHKEVGNVFVHVLEDAGVYKCTEEGREAFMRFVQAL